MRAFVVALLIAPIIGNWSWMRNRTPDGIDLPHRFRSVARLSVRGSAVSNPSNLQPHAYVCLGFRDHIVQRLEFDDHEEHLINCAIAPFVGTGSR
jgi:hypothetical protein